MQIDLKDLHYGGVALPSQLKDAEGRPAAYRCSCGALLPHGEIKTSLDGQNIKRAKEQRIHCTSRLCPKCFRYNLFLDSEDYAQRIWALRQREARRGAVPVLYQVVLSPPKRHKDPLAVYRWTSKEGIDDLKKTAFLILRDMKALGGSLTMHHFAQNGEDGLNNAAITGNDGDPNNWRLALHFHALAVFDTIADVRKISEIAAKYGWVVKIVKNPDGSFCRIKTLDQLKNKLFYLQSHASVFMPDNGGRMMDSIAWFGSATHRSLREIYGPNKGPILKEGYTETDEEGRVLYWYEDLKRFVPIGLETLAEVEKVNSARIFVDAADYRECFARICGLADSLGIPLKYETRKDSKGNKKTVCVGPAEDLPPKDLYALISSDYRYLSTFTPFAEPDRMRPPRKDQIDGRYLWMFREEAAEIEDYKPSKEYLKACEEADQREAEFERQKREALARHKIGGGSV